MARSAITLDELFLVAMDLAIDTGRDKLAEFLRALSANQDMFDRNGYFAELLHDLVQIQPSSQDRMLEYLQNIQQREYNDEINSYVEEIARVALDQNDNDAEAAKDAAHDLAWERVDGAHRVIYTYEAFKSLALVDNWQAGIEEGIVDMNAPNAVEQLVFAAMLQEIEQKLPDEIDRLAEAAGRA